MKIERQDTFMRDAIPARVKLEVTLCFLSSGISYRLLAIFFRISKSSILKFIPEVCDVMYEALDEYLQVPDKREWEDIQVGFHHRWNFPGCCGAIDGKHVVFLFSVEIHECNIILRRPPFGAHFELGKRLWRSTHKIQLLLRNCGLTLASYCRTCPNDANDVRAVAICALLSGQ
ncbi:unnamed protein product [Acanthoscelides obtectus]|uniref:DDE Tnp4 domain-containing protein n=1 Tax=Acanthoscelides obtectus TaxID=200917 RepID=A0A9P0P6A7_ACAOB|nr:unnamed protein product [Acanthoscelides obtectus]CAK1669308.1 hypothetical protein AOBTE_LOCUS26949 [Acanthoscelides obtectus]